MAKGRARSAPASGGPPARKFREKLVLNAWLLSLFGREKFEQLAELVGRSDEHEGLDENNNHRFLPRVPPTAALSADVLRGYDDNIVSHTKALNAHRDSPIRWKYFQWLALLFTEVYLDRFFRNPDALRDDLNAFLRAFNTKLSAKEQLPEYALADLRKVALWNATGSGKTLLMHANLLQFRHYAKAHGRESHFNRELLLTPNEGLSNQHLLEFAAAGIAADRFKDTQQSTYTDKPVEVIEITKLREEKGEKTVATESFGGNNLVLVDEGHRGASGGKETGQWMRARNALCEGGFSFEYSATFGQAVKGRGALEAEYAKCILFDYSYRYFYADGYGKDYRILNLGDQHTEEQRQTYLAACLLGFYQQLRLYADRKAEFAPFLLEKPLWVFVGHTVNAVRTENKQKTSDVVEVLTFLSEFVKNRAASEKRLGQLLKGDSGLLSGKLELFATAFGYLSAQKLDGKAAFADILKVLFNAPNGGQLHVELLKGADGEIELRLGDNEPFGLINVGDAAALCKLCEGQGDKFAVGERDFTGSRFAKLSAEGSPVNVLIGSKKFTEGWNSWRVSTMGLMNVGKSEGAEIIQLFGRGVRLKGRDWCLKRSSRVPRYEIPKDIALLETLNVFGVQSNYMAEFKKALEDEGVPTGDPPKPIELPVIRTVPEGKKLKVVRLPENLDFRRNGPNPTLTADPPVRLTRHPVLLNWYPKVQARQSEEAQKVTDAAALHEAKLEARHVAFMDFDALYFSLQQYKNERGWYSLNLPRAAVPGLLARTNWYKLYVPAAELQFANFGRVKQWEEIAAALLKGYVKKFYQHEKAAWEAEHLEYQELREDDPNFVQKYTVFIDQSQQALAEQIGELREMLETKQFREDWSRLNLTAFHFDEHLYQPLLHFKGTLVEVKPVSLNESETQFVRDLRDYVRSKPAALAGCELYLLRNASKKGMGFFEAGNFYPDFVLWVLRGGKQYVTFVDPKGLRQLDDGLQSEKIQFAHAIKGIEQRLNDPDVVLNSFIVTPTKYADLIAFGAKASKADLTAHNVLFQSEDRDTYVAELLKGVLG